MISRVEHASRKYGFVGWIAARSMLAYFGEVLASTIFLGVIMFIFLNLWRVTFSSANATTLGGLSLPQMLWYLAMTEAILTSRQRMTAAVDHDVRTGAVAVHLLRPLSYPLYRLWTDIGERGVSFALRLVIVSSIALIFVGPIPFSLPGIALFALSVPFAFLLDFLMFFLIGLCAFWLEDTSGLVLIVSRLTMILGGMLIPLELFPDAFQPVLRVLPFSSIVYGPARMFVNPDLEFLLNLILRQGVSIVILAAIVALVYRVALRRINANGG
jgi:ABC-2 type transport system permease protein